MHPNSSEIVKMGIEDLASVIRLYTEAMLDPATMSASMSKFRERRNLAEGIYRRRLAFPRQ